MCISTVLILYSGFTYAYQSKSPATWSYERRVKSVKMCAKLKEAIACREVPVMWKSADQAAWLCLHFQSTQRGSGPGLDNYVYGSMR